MTQDRKPDITVVILTLNEELHIRRVIESALAVTDRIIIVDSFSTDQTITIAKSLGAAVFQHAFVNQAQQFQWAMENCQVQTAWTLRLDADEFLTPELVDEMKSRVPVLDPSVSGVFIKRRVFFLGRWIRYGGYYPIKLLRLWRTGHARIEQRWMDEHTYLVQGTAIEFQHDMVDDNLNNLSWWTEKHNAYSTREAIDILSRKESGKEHAGESIHHFGDNQASRKRWYKQNLYLRMPLFIRCLLYYLFRYWIRLGFLDGRQGLVFHFLQALWYRMLVDAKIWQLQSMARKENKPLSEVIEQRYHISLKPTE